MTDLLWLLVGVGVFVFLALLVLVLMLRAAFETFGQHKDEDYDDAGWW